MFDPKEHESDAVELKFYKQFLKKYKLYLKSPSFEGLFLIFIINPVWKVKNSII